MEAKPKYSGPERSGICKCGCPWDLHHLGVVMNEEYREQTREAYVPGECEVYGFNENGGLKWDKDTLKWRNHCHGYVDSMEDKA